MFSPTLRMRMITLLYILHSSLSSNCKGKESQVLNFILLILVDSGLSGRVWSGSVQVPSRIFFGYLTGEATYILK